MENQDILFQVALRLDNETIGKLLYPQFWNRVKSILSDANFWYERTMYIAKRSLLERQHTNWKKIYQTIEYTLNDPDNKELRPNQYIWRHLDYLPSVLVLEEIFGSPSWNDDSPWNVWEEISDPEVMNYLLDKKYLDLTFLGAQRCLEEAATEGRNQMIRPLTELIDKMDESKDWGEDYAFDALKNSITSGHIDTMELLIEYRQFFTDVNVDINEIVEAAMDGNHEDMIQYIFDNYVDEGASDIAVESIHNTGSVVGLQVSMKLYNIESKLKSIYEQALKNGYSQDLVIYMLEEKLIIEDNIYQRLESSIEQGYLILTEYLLTRIERARVDSHLLLICLSSISPEGSYYPAVSMLKILVSDSRVNPTSNLIDLLTASREGRKPRTRRYLASIVARDERVNVEEMNTQTFKLFMEVLDKNIGCDIVNEAIERQDSIYSLLLRFMLIKSPTSSELLNWMRTKNDKRWLTAAANETSPLRALMILLIHPTVSLDRLLNKLEVEGASRYDLLLTRRIFHVHQENEEWKKSIER